MTNKRIMPDDWTNTRTPVKAEVSKRIDMSDEIAGQGLCPSCKKPMTRAYAAEIPVQACAPCRIALPVPDDEEVQMPVQDIQLFM